MLFDNSETVDAFKVRLQNSKSKSSILAETDKNGCSALLQACCFPDVSFVEFLLDSGADISSKDTSWMWGAMHYAAWKNNYGNFLKKSFSIWNI